MPGRWHKQCGNCLPIGADMTLDKPRTDRQRARLLGGLGLLVVLVAISMLYAPLWSLAAGVGLFSAGLAQYLSRGHSGTVSIRSNGLLGKLWVGFWFITAANPGIALLARPNLYLWSVFSVATSVAFLGLLLALLALRNHNRKSRRRQSLALVSAFLILLVAALSLATTPLVLGDRILAAWGSYISLSCQVVFVLGIFHVQRGTIALLRGLATGLTAGVTLTLVLLLISGGLGSARFGDVEVLHPNTVGALAGIGLIVALTIGRHLNLPTRALSLLFFPIALVLSFSKTSIVATLFAVAIWLLLSSYRERLTRSFLILAAAFGLWALAGNFVIDNLFQYFANQDRAMSLSGRVALWEETVRLSRDRPILGFGFATFPDVIASRSTGLDWNVNRIVHAHNSYLTVLLEQGLVGLALHVWFILVCAFFVFRMWRRDGRTIEVVFAATVLTFLVVRSFSEGSLALRGDFLYLAVLSALLESRWLQPSSENV